MVVLAFFLCPAVAFADVDLQQGAMVWVKHEYWKNLFDHTNDTKDSQNVSVDVTGEYFLPGDFYAVGNRTETVFVGTAVNVKF